MEGLAFGRYRVTRKLGMGGMAEVYVAKHELMDRYAAVKVLLPEMSAREDIVKRFLQEAQAAACIEHPGIVHVYDVGQTEQGRGYLVMELLQGETLNQRLKRQKRMSLDAAVTVIRQLAGVMEAAHQSGIIHRDLKPDNIFLVSDPEVPSGERVKVLDFGLAKLVEVAAPARELTAQGAVFGTPAYMAPEQCKSAASVDGRADVYAIGCLFYACLCGRPPFGTGGIEVLLAHISEKPVPPRQYVPTIPPAIEALILRLLEKDPARRLPSCEALIEELDIAMSATAQLVQDSGAQRRPGANDEATIREDATLQGQVALIGAFERAASQGGGNESDTYETSAAPPPPQPRDAHLIDTQRIPAQKPSTPARASTEAGVSKETRPMRKQTDGPMGATRRLQTSQPVPLPGVAPMQPPTTLPLPGVPPVQASGPAPVPNVPSARASTPALPNVPVRRASAPIPVPTPDPVQSSGPARMPAVTPMHARALRPVDIPWAADAPGDAGTQRAGTEDGSGHGRGSTPTISNGEIEAHRRRVLAQERQRTRGRHMLWAAVGAAVVVGMIVAGSLLSRGEEPEAANHGGDTILPGLEDEAEQGAVEADPRFAAVDALLKQAEQDMAGRQWEQARELLQQASQHEGKDDKRAARVLELATRVSAEKQNKAVFERMGELGGLSNVEELVAEFRKIPEDSAYRAEALALYEAARDEWLEDRSERAERHVRRRECQALAGIVKNAAEMFPGAETGFAAQSAECSKAAEAKAKRQREKDERLQEAQQYYKSGNITLAFTTCSAAWEVADGDEEVARFCGLMACKLKNKQAGKRYYERTTDPQYRKLIMQTCGGFEKVAATAPATTGASHRPVSPARAPRGVGP